MASACCGTRNVYRVERDPIARTTKRVAVVARDLSVEAATALVKSEPVTRYGWLEASRVCSCASDYEGPIVEA